MNDNVDPVLTNESVLPRERARKYAEKLKGLNTREIIHSGIETTLVNLGVKEPSKYIKVTVGKHFDYQVSLHKLWYDEGISIREVFDELERNSLQGIEIYFTT